MNIKQEKQVIFDNNDKTFNWSIVFLTIVLFVFAYFGSSSFFAKTFSSANDLPFWKIIYHNTMAFVLFFLLGLVFTKFIAKKKFSEFGLATGKTKLALIIMAVGTIVAPLIGLSTVLDPSMTTTYPLISLSIYSKWYYVVGYYASYFLYYVGWEYLFRGIGLFSAEKKIGIGGAILFTTMISALIHTSVGGFGKPMVETLSAIPAGLIFGYIATKTRSIWPTIYIHFLIGFFTDIFIYVLA